MTNQRKLYVGLAAVVLLLILFISFHHKKLKSAPIYKASAEASNIQFPYLVNPNTIDFFTGSAFASYDTATDTTQAISPQFTLPTVDDVEWSKTGVLFEASNYNASDDLYPDLIAKYQPTTQSYWWFYNFADQKISLLLPSDPIKHITSAAWNASGSDYAYIENNQVYVSDKPNKPLYKAASDSIIKQFSGNIITLTESNSLVQLSTITEKTKTLVTANFQASYVSADNQTIAYTLDTQPKSNDVAPGDLYEINPTTDKHHKLLSDFNGVMGGSGGNLYVGYADTSGAVHFDYFPKQGAAMSYSIGSILDSASTIKNILPVNSSTIYVDSSINTLIKSSTNKSNKLNTIDKEYLIQGDYYLNGFEIHYDPDNQDYEIVIDQNPYTQYQAAALNYIASKGIDPNQIIIKWSANEGVTDTDPNVDTSAISNPYGGD